METATNGHNPASQRDMEFASALQTTLERGDKPLSSTEVRKALPTPFKRTAKEVAVALEKLAATGRAFRVAGKSPKFSLKDPVLVAKEAVLNALANGAVPATELTTLLKQAVAGVTPKRVLDSMMAAGELYARYKLAKNGKPTKTVESYSLEPPPPDPRPLLNTVKKSLESALKKAKDAGIPEASVLATLIMDSGINADAIWALLPASGSDGKAKLGSVAAAVVASPEADRDAVLARLRALAAHRNTLIEVSALREGLSLDKSRFDRAALELSKRGTVVLHHYDHAGSLSDAERAALIVDQYGTHYIGIALAREAAP